MRCFCFASILFLSITLWLMTGVLPLVAAKVIEIPGLFGPNDNVGILNAANFQDWIIESSPVKIVMFYAAWCGHCQRFAPVYKEFAAEVTGWQAAVDVGVVNCADAHNGQLCRDNQVYGFPTLKLFWIEKGGKGSTIGNDTKARSSDELQHAIIDFIREKVEEKGAPANFPDLNVSRATSIASLWKSLPRKLEHLFVIVETADSYVGRELILDLSTSSKAAVARFIQGTGPSEVKHQKSITFSRLERNGDSQVLVRSEDASTARDKIKDKLKELGYTFNRRSVTTPKPTKPKNVIIGNYSRIYLADFETGIYYTLHQEVPLKNVITERQLSILKSFIRVLYENIDLPPRITNYLINVANKINVKAPINGADFPALLKKAETADAYISNDGDYCACKGSVPGKRGYTCSLWTIFHYATVGSHKRFLRQEISNPHHAVLVIKDYVFNFFSCSECVNHFRDMAKNLESELVNNDEAVLWLWRGHNGVNARLKGDVTEDNERPKIQFPPASLCQECHVAGKFNESQVLKFLHRFYSSGNMVMSNDVSHSNTAQELSSTSNTKYFSGFDLTIFLVIYAVSITLLFIVFVAMVCRRRKGNFNKTFSFSH